MGAVFILFLLVDLGASRGFLRTVIGLAGTLAAVYVANRAGPILARTLYDNVVRDAVSLMLQSRFESALAEGDVAGGLLETVPSGLRRLINPELYAAQTLTPDSELGATADVFLDSLLREPLVSILNSVLFLILFTLMCLGVRYFSYLFGRVYRVPVLGTVNTLLGGILGVLQAGLALFVGALILRLVILISGGGWTWLNEGIMDDTYLWRVFYQLL